MENPAKIPQYLQIYEAEQPLHFKYITEYLVSQCKENCNRDDCFGFHDNQFVRRIPYLLQDGTWNYLPKACYNNPCEMGDRCKYSHNKEECSYHPLVYKVSDCKFNSAEKGKCSKWGFSCSFAHLDEDRRCWAAPTRIFDPQTYKVRRCNVKACKSTECLGYHSLSERRRDQRSFQYSTVPCIFTCKDSPFSQPDACPNKDDCELAHTKFEVYYHKDFYMTKKCKNETCYQTFCAFLHSEERNTPNREEAKKEDAGSLDKVEEHEEIAVQTKEQSAKTVAIYTSEKVEDGTTDKKQIPDKLRCKNCKNREIKWVLECGALVCGKCLSETCVKCKRRHANRIDL